MIEAGSSPAKWRRRGWLRLAGILSIGVLALVLWLDRETFLISLAEGWIVRDAPVRADAIVVLGGWTPERVQEAARLYHRGYAPVVLVPDVALGEATEVGLTIDEEKAIREYLMRLGVPGAAIEEYGQKVTSTHDEAVGIRVWAEKRGARGVLIPNASFFARRSRWIVRRVLSGSGVGVTVCAVEVPRYSSLNWWRNEEALIVLETEVVKMGYYWWKY